MEQVICINNKFIDGYNLANIALELLKEGEIYTVESFEMTLNGIGKYFLKEVSNGDLGWSANGVFAKWQVEGVFGEAPSILTRKQAPETRHFVNTLLDEVCQRVRNTVL